MDGKLLALILLAVLGLWIILRLAKSNTVLQHKIKPGIDTRGMSYEQREQYAHDHNIRLRV